LVKLIAGLDEAGRGPIIGPLVVASVLIPEELSPQFTSMGVKDSKMLTAGTRTELAERIRGLALKICVIEAQPTEIDEAVHRLGKLRKLNYLEAQLMANAIADVRPDEAYVDAPDVREGRFAEQIREILPPDLKQLKIISKHHADRIFPAVSAASIIAKVRRDEVAEELRRKYGDFGSGYLSDHKTLDFVRAWRQAHGDYPSIVRRSWKTIKEIERGYGQSRLSA
jgi:ribonuclease HII